MRQGSKKSGNRCILASGTHWPATLHLLQEEALPVKECFYSKGSNSKPLVKESARSPRVNLIDGHPNEENAKSSPGNASHNMFGAGIYTPIVCVNLELS